VLPAGGHRLGQTPDPVQITAVEGGFRGLGQPAGSVFRFGGQLGRALPGRRRLQGCSLASGGTGGGIQRIGGRVIRARRGRGQLPGRALGVASGQRLRQCLVGCSALRRDGHVICDRSHQRMGEFDPVAGEADQTGRFGLEEGVAVAAT
jgi:hypothetical protein